MQSCSQAFETVIMNDKWRCTLNEIIKYANAIMMKPSTTPATEWQEMELETKFTGKNSIYMKAISGQTHKILKNKMSHYGEVV